MPDFSWLIIDGYSLLHRDPDAAAWIPDQFPLARRYLVRRLETLAGRLAERITLVFDGHTRGPAEEFPDGPVEVVFTVAHGTADTLIENWVFHSPHPGHILVITSDRMEREAVDASGARSLGCGDFLSWCRELESTSGYRRRPVPKEPFHRSMGDAFPEEI